MQSSRLVEKNILWEKEKKKWKMNISLLKPNSTDAKTNSKKQNKH